MVPVVVGIGNGLLLGYLMYRQSADKVHERTMCQRRFAILVSLVGVRGKEIVNPYVIPMPVRAPIDRDLLLLPDILCETFEWDRGRGMRPVIDAIWQASGSGGSPSYDPTGAWKPDN